MASTTSCFMPCEGGRGVAWPAMASTSDKFLSTYSNDSSNDGFLLCFFVSPSTMDAAGYRPHMLGTQFTLNHLL